MKQTPPPPPGSLRDLAARISAHLKRFEADVRPGGINWWIDGKVGGLKHYYGVGAGASGRYVGVTYVRYQGSTFLTKAEAERYVAALDEGYVGRHFELFRKDRS